MDSLRPHLPNDVFLFEILTRTSRETVARCKLVSKLWNEATYEDRFSQLFHQRTKTVSGFYVQSLNHSNYSSAFISTDNNNIENLDNLSLSFLPGLYKIEVSTKQGLLLCLGKNPKRSARIPRYIVCKPTTQEWQQIPNPKTRYFTRKTTMVVLGSNPIRYKIVRFSDPKPACVFHKSKLYTSLRCEIFDSETWAWKYLPENIKLPYGEFWDFKPMVSTSGLVYSLTTEKRLFVFDLEKESWELCSLPHPLCEVGYCKVQNMQLLEYEGKLALLCMVTEECMELWVIMNHNNNNNNNNNNNSGQTSWSLRRRENLQSVIRKDPYASPVAFCNNDVAMIKSTENIIFYNLQNSVSNEVECHIFGGQKEFFRVELDWEPVKLTRPQRRSSRSRLVIKLLLGLIVMILSLVGIWMASNLAN
ncbi:F-box domain containing protein [Trema orientale]|uniref:F-box domain containing protein n=1 Tax=Trema orientale TaxID=63057 RepID=A0A2P5F0H6_TREOI|nr:F-box domain containing protein [Trema orientale]